MAVGVLLPRTSHNNGIKNMTESQLEAPQTYTCRSAFMTCVLPNGLTISFKNGVYKAETQGEVNDFQAFLAAQKPVHRSKYNRVDYRRAAAIAASYLAEQGPQATQGVSTTSHRPHPVNTVNALLGQAEDAEAAAKEIAAVAAGADPSEVAAKLAAEGKVLPIDPNLPVAGAVVSEPAVDGAVVPAVPVADRVVDAVGKPALNLG